MVGLHFGRVKACPPRFNWAYGCLEGLGGGCVTLVEWQGVQWDEERAALLRVAAQWSGDRRAVFCGATQYNLQHVAELQAEHHSRQRCGGRILKLLLTVEDFED